MTSLTPRTLRSAARRLAAADPVLGASVERFGPPPLWGRDPSYATLHHWYSLYSLTPEGRFDEAEDEIEWAE